MKRLLGFLLLLAACGGEGGGALFDSQGNPIAEFRILSPSDGGAANDAEPLIRWSPVFGAFGYEMLVWADDGRSSLIEVQRVPGTSARLTTRLADGRVCYAEVHATLGAGTTVTTGLIKFKVVLVPEPFPEMTLSRHDPLLATGGFKLFNLIDRNPPEGERKLPAMVLVNAAGEIVWWYVHPGVSGLIEDARVTDYGTLVYMVRHTDEAGVVHSKGYEIDWEGNFLWESRPGIDIHHEIAPGPGDDRMYLRWIFEEVDGVVYEGDGIEIVDPATNEVEWTWNIFDHYRPEDRVVPEAQELGISRAGVDWSHANAVVWDEERSVIWISIRHFDQLVAIDYPSGNIRFVIGDEGVPGDGYVHHAHAPEVQGDGSILFFDNGNGQAPPVTRVKMFRFDEATGTFDPFFVWEDTPPFFDPFVGDADRQENGNILITSGASARLLEITILGDIVWDLQVGGGRYILYRADQVPAAFIPAGVLP